jgi:hypothetical protein
VRKQQLQLQPKQPKQPPPVETEMVLTETIHSLLHLHPVDPCLLKHLLFIPTTALGVTEQVQALLPRKTMAGIPPMSRNLIRMHSCLSLLAISQVKRLAHCTRKALRSSITSSRHILTRGRASRNFWNQRVLPSGSISTGLWPVAQLKIKSAMSQWQIACLVSDICLFPNLTHC